MSSSRHWGLVSSITAPSPAVDPTGPLPPVSRSRRRTELIMLVFAFALVLFALANVGFTLKGSLPAGAAVYMAVTWPSSSWPTWPCGGSPRGLTRCCSRSRPC